MEEGAGFVPFWNVCGVRRLFNRRLCCGDEDCNPGFCCQMEVSHASFSVEGHCEARDTNTRLCVRRRHCLSDAQCMPGECCRVDWYHNKRGVCSGYGKEGDYHLVSDSTLKFSLQPASWGSTCTKSCLSPVPVRLGYCAWLHRETTKKSREDDDHQQVAVAILHNIEGDVNSRRYVSNNDITDDASRRRRVHKGLSVSGHDLLLLLQSRAVSLWGRYLPLPRFSVFQPYRGRLNPSPRRIVATFSSSHDSVRSRDRKATSNVERRGQSVIVEDDDDVEQKASDEWSDSESRHGVAVPGLVLVLVLVLVVVRGAFVQPVHRHVAEEDFPVRHDEDLVGHDLSSENGFYLNGVFAQQQTREFPVLVCRHDNLFATQNGVGHVDQGFVLGVLDYPSHTCNGRAIGC
ncbi:hypothetical protein C0Q70_08238 [Pomacea canaliculata]|uniref:Uncharacterized protein n=1 Tax=Pomacea canaliculata TaxID=400727 RepID=A0A2T7PH97_POMCA|nr:hypothetical protein C0Q70_08238 [Pomacea canaliculata]